MTDVDERAIAVLVAHQRHTVSSCLCGWDQLGASHAEHVWRMLKLVLGDRLAT